MKFHSWNNEDKTDRLPASPKLLVAGTVTAVTVQKKDPNRVSIFIDGEFCVGLPIDIAYHFGIKKNAVITDEIAQKVNAVADKAKLKTYLVDLLSRREHSAAELKQKASKKDYPTFLIEECIEELQEKGFQSDTKFAMAFVKDKYTFNKWGPEKIKQALALKGIKGYIAKEALEQIQDKDQEIDIIHNLIRKKQKSWANVEEYKLKQKIYGHLSRKGFKGNSILSEMQTLIAIVKNAEPDI